MLPYLPILVIFTKDIGEAADVIHNISERRVDYIFSSNITSCRSAGSTAPAGNMAPASVALEFNMPNFDTIGDTWSEDSGHR
jgi:hypothetical protein